MPKTKLQLCKLEQDRSIGGHEMSLGNFCLRPARLFPTGASSAGVHAHAHAHVHVPAPHRNPRTNFTPIPFCMREECGAFCMPSK